MATGSNGGGSVALESALRTCKVDTAWANKVESDRFLNPANMVCPLWNGIDTAGRPACPDSFMTKRAGCNSAADRVVVENSVSRPQYMEFINLNANGIDGSIYAHTAAQNNVVSTQNSLHEMANVAGQFGNGFNAGTSQVLPPCQGSGRSGAMSAYQQGMMQVDHAQGNAYGKNDSAHEQALHQNSARNDQYVEQYSKCAQMRGLSGF
jgi:hypothetical protein